MNIGNQPASGIYFMTLTMMLDRRFPDRYTLLVAFWKSDSFAL
jgi:hypothetical protein